MANDNDKIMITPRPAGTTLNKLMNLPINDFRWKDTGESGIGPNADDIRRIFPEAFYTNGVVDMVDYSKLIPHLILAIQEIYGVIQTCAKSSRSYQIVMREEISSIEEKTNFERVRLLGDLATTPPTPYTRRRQQVNPPA